MLIDQVKLHLLAFVTFTSPASYIHKPSQCCITCSSRERRESRQSILTVTRSFVYLGEHSLAIASAIGREWKRALPSTPWSHYNPSVEFQGHVFCQQVTAVALRYTNHSAFSRHCLRRTVRRLFRVGQPYPWTSHASCFDVEQRRGFVRTALSSV